MKKGIAKYTAFVLAAGLTIGETGAAAFASPTTVLAGFGSSTETAKETAAKAAAETETTQQAASEEEALTETIAESEETAREIQPAATAEALPAEDTALEEEAPAEEESTEPDTSMVGTTGFAQCEEYLNVRTSAGTDGEVVGKVYNNGSMEILGVAPNGWYQVRSGNVEGYVSPDFVATGDTASEIAASTGYTTAEVGTEVLNVRAGATTDADIIATVDNTNVIEVVEDQGDWIKVILDGEMYGYVSADYVATTTEYATGETLEEEQERLDQEWLAYLAEQEAAQAAAEAAYLAAIAQQTQAAAADTASYGYTETYTETYTEPDYYQAAPEASYSPQTVDVSGDLSAQCDTAYQNYLDAQAAADAAVANGEGEQAIVDTAAEAQAAYAEYVEYQNQVDAASVSAAVETAPADTGYTDTAYTDTAYTDTSYTEDGYTDTSYTDDQYTEAAVTEEPAAQSSGASSMGQAIADYACQFVGNPYVYGGSSLTNGADCSGFTMSVMANFGISLPHNAAAQSGCGTPVSLDSLQPGDLLFYQGDGGIGHVTMYIGNGQVVHASNPTNGILISSIDYRTPCSARRFV